MWYIYKMEYSAIKKNEIRPCAGTCMDRKTVTLSEVSQIEENKHQMINLRKKMHLFTKRRLTDWENKFMVSQGKRWGGDKLESWDKQIYTLLYIK